MQYALFRISVVPRDQTDLFGSSGATIQPTRQEHLRSTFSQQHAFVWYSNTFQYAPIHTQGDAYLGGVIVKAVSVVLSTPLRDGLRQYEAPDHPHVDVILSLMPGQDEQICAVGISRRVGNPQRLIKSLINTINDETRAESWELIVNPLSDVRDFFAIANQYRGLITKIEFTLAVPNIVSLMAGDLRETLTKARDNAGAQEMTVGYNNKDGKINPDADEIRIPAEQVSEGLGRATIRTLKGIVYKSDRKIRHIDIPDKNPIVHLDELTFLQKVKELFISWRK